MMWLLQTKDTMVISKDYRELVQYAEANAIRNFVISKRKVTK